MKRYSVGVSLLFAGLLHTALSSAEPQTATIPQVIAQPQNTATQSATQNTTQSATKNTAAPLSGDAERGRLVFGSCRTCHLPDKGAGNHNGPNLFAIFGRKAGTREGFLYYSETLKKADFVWTPELLDVWLANPGGFLPDSAMIFVGVPDPQRRADLIEYLKTFHD